MPPTNRSRRGPAAPTLAPARHLAGWGLALLAALIAPGPARGDLVLSTPSFTDAPGDIGRFAVLVTNTGIPGVDRPYDISAFSAQVSIDPASGVTFTGISAATTPPSPFLFDGLPTDGLNAQDGGTTPPTDLGTTTPSMPSLSFSGVTSLFFRDSTTPQPTGDPDVLTVPFRTLAPGESAVVAIIGYAIAPSAPSGGFALTLDPPSFLMTGGLSDLSGPNGSQWPFTVDPGTLTIRSVPEPSAFAPMAIGVVPLAVRQVRRRRVRRS